MRIAVIQLEIDPLRRAAALQSALRAIDSAADTDPAPDLILLPAFCDIPAIRQGLPGMSERISGAVVAACGLRARQWGVFVAFGMAETVGGRQIHASTILLDRDGDVVGHHRARRLDARLAARCTPGDQATCVGGLLGCIALMGADDGLDETAWEAAAGAGARLALIASGGSGGSAQEVMQRIEAIAIRARAIGCATAIADVVVTGDGGHRVPAGSFLSDASGSRLCIAPIDATAILHGELRDGPVNMPSTQAPA